MWELITKYEPPTPPAPQPPYEEVDNFPPWTEKGGYDFDDLLETTHPHFKISYCPLLLDPRVSGYDWVHRTLRETVFKCCE